MIAHAAFGKVPCDSLVDRACTGAHEYLCPMEKQPFQVDGSTQVRQKGRIYASLYFPFCGPACLTKAQSGNPKLRHLARVVMDRRNVEEDVNA